MANSEQYATMISEMGNETLQAVVNNAKNVWGTLPNTNWYDEILHTALTHNHSLDISGGTEKATYSVGTSYLILKMITLVSICVRKRIIRLLIG